jgi:hypothetical protein
LNGLFAGSFQSSGFRGVGVPARSNLDLKQPRSEKVRREPS